MVDRRREMNRRLLWVLGSIVLVIVLLMVFNVNGVLLSPSAKQINKIQVAPGEEVGSVGSINRTHSVCSGNQCVLVSGTGVNECATSADCQTGNVTHSLCSGSSCIVVTGPGVNECSVNADCQTGNVTHLECVGLACVAVTGAGVNQCSSSANCQSNNTNQTHLACVGNACQVVSGAGVNQCSSSAQCSNQTGNSTLKADLIIQNLTVISVGSANQSLNGTKPVTFQIVVKNIGQASAVASSTRLFSAYGENIATSALSVGQSVTLTRVQNVLPGSRSVTANADILGQVQESSESNNAKSVSFVVP